MDDFRYRVKVAIEALVGLNYTRHDALALLYSDNRAKFCNYFMDAPAPGDDTKAGWYRIDHSYIPFAYMTENVDREVSSRVGDIGGRPANHSCFSIDNHKIYTIKVVRAITGWHLKDAKEFVEGKPTFIEGRHLTLLKEMFGVNLVLAKKDDGPSFGDILRDVTK